MQQTAPSLLAPGGESLQGPLLNFSFGDAGATTVFHLNRSQINLLLFLLVLLDVWLSTVAIFFPRFWTETFHGLPPSDGDCGSTRGLWLLGWGGV